MAAEGRFALFSNDSPFSLQYAAPFAIQGKTFNCVLQYLMYRKADLFKDKEHAIDIMTTTDLKQIERYGKNIRNVNTHTWNKERIKVAELAFREKFTQNPDLKEQLLATFPRTLVYATTKDRFWSIGLPEQNPKALVMKEWKSDNILGFILTEVRDKLMENRFEEGADRQDQRVEGQVSRDSMRQDGIGNSRVEEGQVSRDNMRQDGGGNSIGVGEQASWDSKRQHGIGNSHVVKAHTSRDSIRQGGIENSHVVEGQVNRDSMRHGTIGNSHGLQGQANRDRKRHGRKGNSHRVEGNTVRDSMSQDGGGNSHVVEGHASRESLRQGGGGASQRTEGKTSRAYQEQGGDSKDRGVEGPTSQSRNRQGGKGKSQQLERPATHGSYRQDGRGWRGLEVGHRENHDGCEDQNWRDRSEVEWEKKGQPVTEGGEYKESERRSDWQKVTEEMPQWEETEPTSRPKRKMTQEQTDYNWNKHGRRNMGLRNTKATHTDMPNQDKFVLFFGNQSPFSQHHPANFTIGGITFNCAEQYMMYQKTVIFENKEMERKIMETSNPVQQKRYGRQIPEFKFEVWKKYFLEVVDRATEAKFSQNPHLLEHLFATHPKLLVEASPSDRLWGIGRGQKDPLAWDKETWRGKNQLGYIITRVRDRLMEVKDTHWEEWEKWKDDKRWEEEEAREKMEKRRWESVPSYPYRGRHEESYKHVSGKERIELFWGIKSPFSQHYAASFTIDGQTFTSAEQFTLYQMAVIFEDQECQEKIMSTSDPKKQDRYTYEIPNFRWDVWEQKCVQVVERGITAKFTQNSELKRQLFATYPKLLAECTHKESYWGIGYGLGFAKDSSKGWDTSKWRGKNVLGYTLTAVRDRLIEMEKGQKELDVEDVRLQGTIEGDGAHLDRKILVEEEDRTGKEAAVGGEDGEIQQGVTTEKDENKEADKEIRRSDADVEEDESKPHREQDVRENFVSEEEEVTVGGSEMRENEDADSTLAGDRNMMEQHQRARNSVGEEGNNGSVPLEGEDDGTEEEGVVGLDSTEVAEGNVAEQQKLQKRIGEELKKEEEVTSLAEDESSTKENNEEEGESTENEEAERLENGCIGEEVTFVKSDVAEDDNVDALNSTNERAMNTEEQLEVAGKTAGEVATIEEDNKVVPETDTLEGDVDRVGEGGRETLDQQEGVGERVNQEEEVTQVPDEETFGGRERDEMEESEMLGTEKEVLREATSVPEGMGRDAEGGRTVMERVEKEGNDTGKDVKTEEEVTSPEGTERDCKGGVKARERVEKEGNDAGKEVKRDKEVPFVEGTSVVDVETLAGGERDGDNTKKDPEKVKSEQIDMDVEDVGVEDAGEDMKKLNDAGKEVKNGEDVMLVPEDNVIERQCEGERKDPDRETWAVDAMDEVKTEKRMPEAKTLFEEERDEGERKDPDHETGASDILDKSKTEKRMPEASTLFEEKYADESQSGDEEEQEKGDTGDGEDVKTEEEVHKTEDKSVMETDEGGKKDLELVEKGEDAGTRKEPTTVGEEFDARNEGNIRGEYERKATVQQKKMSDSAESADLEEDITSGTGGEQDVMKEGEGGDGMEQEERERTGDVYTELATVVGTERNPQTEKVEEEIDIIDPRGPNKGLKGEADETVAESADLEEDITSGTGGEQDVMKEGEGGDGMEQEEREKTGDVYTESADLEEDITSGTGGEQDVMKEGEGGDGMEQEEREKTGDVYTESADLEEDITSGTAANKT